MGNGNDMKVKEVNGKELEQEICLLKITTWKLESSDIIKRNHK